MNVYLCTCSEANHRVVLPTTDHVAVLFHASGLTTKSHGDIDKKRSNRLTPHALAPWRHKHQTRVNPEPGKSGMTESREHRHVQPLTVWFTHSHRWKIVNQHFFRTQFYASRHKILFRIFFLLHHITYLTLTASIAPSTDWQIHKSRNESGEIIHGLCTQISINQVNTCPYW